MLPRSDIPVRSPLRSVVRFTAATTQNGEKEEIEMQTVSFAATEQTPSPENDTKNARIRSLPRSQTPKILILLITSFCCLGVKWADDGAAGNVFFLPQYQFAGPNLCHLLRVERGSERKVGGRREILQPQGGAAVL